MNLSLDNPYGDVNIPRAKLRSSGDSTVIINPMSLDSVYNNHKSSLNPYGAFRPGGESPGHSEGTKVGEGNGDPSNTSAYQVQSSYTVKDDTEEDVGRCRACCLRCRRK